MALIKCRECGNEMSENATSYPHCGNPNTLTKEEKQAEVKKQKNDETVGTVIVVIVVFTIIGLVVGAMVWWDNNDMDNKMMNGVVEGINTITDTYIEHEQEKEKDKEVKNRIYDIFGIE